MSATTPALFRLVARLERNPEATAAVRTTLLKSGADLHLFRCSGSYPRFVELHAEISLAKSRRLPSVLSALEAFGGSPSLRPARLHNQVGGPAATKDARESGTKEPFATFRPADLESKDRDLNLDRPAASTSTSEL